MTKLTGGEAIVQSLIAQGVDTIFGLPGVQNDYLYIALHDVRDQIRVIHTRHEQATAYMALGYAMSSQKEGVYSVVPGPGILNASGALATAYANNAKVLCLTGQIPTRTIGQGYGMLHEIPDQLGILQRLTKWAHRITDPTQAPELVNEAFRQMRSGRPRPVALEVAPDVLSKKSEVTLEPDMVVTGTPPLDLDEIDAAAKLLGSAAKPVIFVGGGAMDAGPEIQQLAEMLQAPVVGYRMGKGVLSSHHYLSQTITVGHALWAAADVVLALGTRLQTQIQRWGVDPDLQIVQVDIDPEEHGRMTRPAVSLVARCEDVLPPMLELVSKYNKRRPSRQEELAALKAEADKKFAYLEPQLSYMYAMREALPDDGIIVEEMTQVGYVSRMMLPVYHPRTYISTGYQGTLGWGFPTSLGVKIANPDKPVISMNGDGGFMFSVQELATAVQHNIGVIILIFNDGAYGNVRRMQKELYGGRIIASELTNPDFMTLAKAFGLPGVRVHSPAALSAAITEAAAHDGPTLIEIPIGEVPSPSKFWRLPRVRG